MNYGIYQLPVHPEEVTERLFKALPKRTKNILEQRFGLGKSSERMTLEAIGQRYGITRERVRQVEADGLSRIRRSAAMQELKNVFAAMESYFERQGKVLKEEHVLKNLSSHPKHENHVYFLLTLHDPFLRFHESDELHDRWAFGKNAEEEAEKSLDGAVGELKKIGQPVKEPELMEILSASSRAATGGAVPQPVLANWLAISKLISKNYFSDWGLIEFPDIKPRGVRDLSYMVLARQSKPMHFSEVAAGIKKLTGKLAHTQTVHNELIKDERFVLVGRGLYALRSWGFAPGVVKDVILETLKNNGPMLKDKIIAAVLKQRFVKPNTVAINLDSRSFKKLPDGRYCLK